MASMIFGSRSSLMTVKCLVCLYGLVILLLVGSVWHYRWNYRYITDIVIGSDNEYSRKILPHAIMIGSKKCGTGMFMGFLSLHPDVCSPRGEPHYFDKHYNKSIEWYIQRLPQCQAHKILMEKSPKYFVDPSVPERIYKMNSTIKLLLIVRDPTTRLISDFVHESGLGNTRVGFETAVLDNVTGSLNMTYEPVTTSIYVEHLKRYLKYFKPAQILIIDGEAFINDPLPELKKAEKFLSLRSYLDSSHFALSEEKGYFCKVVDGRQRCAGRNKGREHPEVSGEILQRIRDFYRPYNEQFFELIHRRFAWS